MLDELLSLGFRKIGHWELRNDAIALSLTDMSDASPALYAFVLNGQVNYVGKTSRLLRQRLYGYAKGSGTQRTNIRVRALILDSLRSGQQVEIYGFSDDQPQRIGRFLLSKSAGLEDNIIEQLNPEWNWRGGGNCSATRGDEAGEVNQNTDHDIEILSVEQSHSARQLSSLKPQFACKIGATYYRQGFFNVPVSCARYFGEHGQAIQVEVVENQDRIQAKINRTVNVGTNSPRIMGGFPLRNWFQRNLSEGDMIQVAVLSMSLIRLYRN